MGIFKPPAAYTSMYATGQATDSDLLNAPYGSLKCWKIPDWKRLAPCKTEGIFVCADPIDDRQPPAHPMTTGTAHALPAPSAGAATTSTILFPSARGYTPLTNASDAAGGSTNRHAPGAGPGENVSGLSMPPSAAFTHSTGAVNATMGSWYGRAAARMFAGCDGVSAGPSPGSTPDQNKKGEGTYVPIVQLPM